MSGERAKPLNSLTRAALPRGIEAWDDEIDYLKNAISNTSNEGLLLSLKTKHDALVRSREWLQSKLDSTED